MKTNAAKKRRTAFQRAMDVLIELEIPLRLGREKNSVPIHLN